MKSMSKSEFKARALEVLRNIEQDGNPIIITNRGKPTLEVKKLRQSEEEPLKLLKGTVINYDGPTLPVAEDDWENA